MWSCPCMHLQARVRIDVIEVLERGGELGQHRGCVSQVHPALIVATERVDEATKLSAMPLLWGLQTGVLIGVRPSDLAMRRVSCAM